MEETSFGGLLIGVGGDSSCLAKQQQQQPMMPQHAFFSSRALSSTVWSSAELLKHAVHASPDQWWRSSLSEAPSSCRNVVCCCGGESYADHKAETISEWLQGAYVQDRRLTTEPTGRD